MSSPMNAIFKPVPHKLTVEAYYDLPRTGHLGEDDRVELIDGVIIEMAPIGSDHVTAVNRLNRALVLAVGDAGVVPVQNTVTLPPCSAPQRARHPPVRAGASAPARRRSIDTAAAKPAACPRPSRTAA